MTPNDDFTQAAATALDNFASGPAAQAADGLAEVFEQAGDRIASSLERAAVSGELSFNALVESIARDFASLAIDQLITAPLEGFVGSLTSSLSGAISGQRAPVTVNMNLSNAGVGATGPQASSGQIAARVAQALSRSAARTQG